MRRTNHVVQAAVMLVLMWGASCYSPPPPTSPKPKPKPHDAGHDSGAEPHDAGAASDAGEDAGPVRHSACSLPLPSHLPGPPVVTRNAAKEPIYNDWPEATCDAGVFLADCAPELPCFPGMLCASSRSGAKSTCLESDGEGAFLTYRDGDCAVRVPAQLKSDLCCSGIPGFDCRRWPFHQDGVAASKPGELCVTHADCESGLLCSAAGGEVTGSGRCVCPGLSAADLRNPPECGDLFEPKPWGGAPLSLPDGCGPGLSAGWVVEAIGSEDAEHISAALAPDGSIHLLVDDWRDQGAVAHLTLRAGVWSRESIATGFSTSSLVIGADGTLHAAFGAPLRYAASTGGPWSYETIDAQGYLPTLTLDSSGSPAIAYLVHAGTLDEIYLATRSNGSWTHEYAEKGIVGGSLILTYPGGATNPYLIYGVDPNSLYNAGRSPTGWSYDTLCQGDLPASAMRDGIPYVTFSCASGADSARTHREEAALCLLVVDSTQFVAPQVLVDLGVRGYREDFTFSSIAMDTQKQAAIAFTAPSGILYSEENRAWHFDELVPEAAPPVLVFDAADQPHIFYAVLEKSPFDFTTVLHSELRHIHRGTCPTKSH